MIHKALEFQLVSSIPRKMSVEVKPEIYLIDPTGIVKLSPISDKELTDEDLLMFDEEFAGTLLISSSDIIQGKLRGKIYKYEFNKKKDPAFLIKIYKINEEGNTIYDVYRIYKVEEGTLREVYSERITDINPSKRTKKLKEILGSLVSKLDFP